MAEDFGSALKNLLALSNSRSRILQVAAARAARRILGPDAVDHPSLRAKDVSLLLKNPGVTGALWVPDRSKALELAAQFPHREKILSELSHKRLSAVTKSFLKAAGPAYDPEQCDDPRYRLEAGNNAVKQIAALEKFEPDIRKLFLIYLALFKRGMIERLDWSTMNAADERSLLAVPMLDVPGHMGALTTSHQLAWAASRRSSASGGTEGTEPLFNLLEQLSPELRGPSPKSQWAAAQFLEDAASYLDVDDAPVFGGESGSPAISTDFDPAITIQTLYPPSPPETPPPSPLSEPPARYAGVTFRRDTNKQAGKAVPNEMTLQTQKWYWLEVAVRCEPTGVDSDEPPKPMRKIRQKRPEKLLVTTDSEDFEIDPNLGEVTLPPTGDSTQNALFRVRHKREQLAFSDRARIKVRIFSRLNLLEYLTVSAKVGLEEQMETVPVLCKHQESVAREALDFDEFVPRAMNIHVHARDGVYFLEFTILGRGTEQIALRGQNRLSEQALDHQLVRLREILRNLSLKDYLNKLKGSPDEFREAIWLLAEFGHELWHELFAKALAGSDLYLVGKALKERPIRQGGIIQVSLAQTGYQFIYPWAFLYDRGLPDREKKNYEVPDLGGFWGYRYGIEQLLSENLSDLDVPVQIEGKMQMAFMLWDSFPNTKEQIDLMKDFTSESHEAIQITEPPITSIGDCYKLLRNGTHPILYFFTHGYCRKLRSSANPRDAVAFVKEQMALVGQGTDEWRRLEALAARIKEIASEPDKSYIELSQGRLYYHDFLDAVDDLPSRPFVFLNMCESAEIIPFLKDNFVQLFLGLNARAVLGTECDMSVTFAHPFSKVFLREVFRGKRLADALRTTRRHFLDRQNPLGLAYTLFGSGTLRFLPARITDDRQTKKEELTP